jgi:hypothetical protein
MEISVLVDSVPHAIKPSAGDLVRLEREYGIKPHDMAEETFLLEHVMYLAYRCLRRTRALSDEVTFDGFLDLADVEDEDGPLTVPLPPLPSP